MILKFERNIRNAFIEWGILIYIVIIAGIVAYQHLFTRVEVIGKRYRFEQEWLVPSVAVACGLGFVTPVAPYPEKMRLFLEQRAKSMNYTDLPRDWQLWANSPFVKTHRYMLLCLGYLWRIFGIDWDVLKGYAICAFIITVVFSYGSLRLLCGRVIGIIGSILVTQSPSLLYLLPSIRDYSKSMFFVMFIFLLLLWIKKNQDLKWSYGVAILMGICAGIGIGFRQDMLVLVIFGGTVIAIIALYQFYYCPSLRMFGPILVYTASFLIIGLPILIAIFEEKGAVSSHSFVQGLSYRVEEDSLGGRASYRLVYDSNDMLVHSTIIANARVFGFSEPFPNYLSPAYGVAGRQYIKRVLYYFPADIWGRFFSCASLVFSVPFRFVQEQKLNYPEFLRKNPYLTLVDYMIFWDVFRAYVGPWVILGIIFLKSVRNLYIGLFWGGCIIFLLGYVSILFEPRHVVHLIPIMDGLILFFIAETFRFLKEYLATEKGQVSKKLVTGLLALLMGMGIFFFTYAILLIVQRYQVRELLNSYSNISWERIENQSKEENTETVILSPKEQLPAEVGIEKLNPFEVPFEFLRIDFVLSEGIYLRSRYDSTYVSIDFSEDYETMLKCYDERYRSGKFSLFIPVYYASTIVPMGEVIFNNQSPIIWARGRWLGIEVQKDKRDNILSMYRAKGIPNIPLLLSIVSPQDSTNLCGFAKDWDWGWNLWTVNTKLKNYEKIYVNE